MGQYGPRELMLACVEKSNDLSSSEPTTVIISGRVEGDTRRTLVLLCVRRCSRTEERNSQDTALTGEPILGLGQYSHAVSIFAEVCELHG
jgi:hypothetical protein